MQRAAQHEAQLQHSSCTHGKQVAQLNSMHTEVLAAAHIQSKIDLEQQQQTLSHQHQAHLQSVQAEKDAFIARNQAEHASDLASVTANYSAVLAEVQESNRAFLIQRSAVQASEHASQMASLQSEHEAQQADAARQSQAALAQLRHEYEQSMRQQLSAKDSDISVVQSNLQSANADVAALTRDVAHLQLLAEQHQLQLKTQVSPFTQSILWCSAKLTLLKLLKSNAFGCAVHVWVQSSLTMFAAPADASSGCHCLPL